jgi:hypothetical protein
MATFGSEATSGSDGVMPVGSSYMPLFDGALATAARQPVTRFQG